MKKALLLLSLFVLNVQGQEQIKSVLFIGNSLTYYNDMPQKLQAMLQETHPEIRVEQTTFPGYSLSSHLTNIITERTENGVSTRLKRDGEITESEEKICEKAWDVIVLQTGGVEALIPEVRELKNESSHPKNKRIGG